MIIQFFCILLNFWKMRLRVLYTFLGFYATLVYITCSQLEKLRVKFFGQKHDTSEQDLGAETDQEYEEEVHTSLRNVLHMEKTAQQLRMSTISCFLVNLMTLYQW
jgi:hypothetical protein